MNTTLSIVIPCHNEADGLTEILATYAHHIGTRDDIEVVIVNDASTDTSADILVRCVEQYPFLRVVTNMQSGGYGNAILSGLTIARGTFIGWTHGDTQTPPADVFRALEIIEKCDNPENIYLKGQRYGRPLLDRFFTCGMSILETLYLRTPLWDINAQPNIFHRSFFATWHNPPKDFSFDLFALYCAKKADLKIVRFPVHFGPRKYGVSTWNTGMRARIKFIMRTLRFSTNLKRALND